MTRQIRFLVAAYWVFHKCPFSPGLQICSTLCVKLIELLRAERERITDTVSSNPGLVHFRERAPDHLGSGNAQAGPQTNTRPTGRLYPFRDSQAHILEYVRS